MNEKFTPGPWNVAGFDSRINEERYFGIGTPHGQMIVESFGECDSNRKANAALIATAPEMYRKLEWLQREFDESDDEELVAIGWEIELILKKARGER